MIGRNVIVKIAKYFLNTTKKIHNAENPLPLPLPSNRQKNERISLTYSVNDHVYSKSKSI